MSVRKRILLVDGDDSLRGALEEQLTLHEEFSVSVARSGQEALERAQDDTFDMILMDGGLPDIHGREVCRLLRCANVSVPVIMLTGADSDDDQILGLESGANDYVTKPFRLGVLLARIRAQLRQHAQSEGATFAIGPYSFRPSAKVLLVDGEKKTKVRLTEKETSILKYLCRIGNQVVPRDVLLSEVWGYNAGVTTHTLETHIYRLRQKIEADPSNATLLVTAPGGYRLNA